MYWSAFVGYCILYMVSSGIIWTLCGFSVFAEFLDNVYIKCKQMWVSKHVTGLYNDVFIWIHTSRCFCVISIYRSLWWQCIDGMRCEFWRFISVIKRHEWGDIHADSFFSGFAGENCEVDVDECESQPCENDGECFQRSSSSLYRVLSELDTDFTFEHAAGYLCHCRSGFTGDCYLHVIFSLFFS